ncbi:MAG: hypothetical protein IKU17_05365 [Clostridia bacterium]|nr:hypothetical protein [Clostridia bacterium]
MKTKKLVRRILFAAAVLAVLLAMAACQNQQAETMLQPPIEGLTWGMTREEAKDALGLSEEEIHVASDSGNLWWLTPEQAGLENAELAGLELYGKEPFVAVAFKAYAGVERLYQVDANVQAENGPALKESLTAVYGEPYVGDWTLWSGTDFKKNATKADMEKLDEYDLSMAMQITGGEQKLFPLRPFVTVQYYSFGEDTGPVLESESTHRFRVTYKADQYLLSLYGSAPLPEYRTTLDMPILSWVSMGMSRSNFGSSIGRTEEEMETKYKGSILVSCEELELTEHEFLGFEIVHNQDGAAPQDMIFYFDEYDAYLCCIQANVTAESEEALQAGLTELLGEPSVVDGEMRWYGYDYYDTTMMHDYELYAAYFSRDLLPSNRNVYTLCVYFDLGFDYGS